MNCNQIMSRLLLSVSMKSNDEDLRSKVTIKNTIYDYMTYMRGMHSNRKS